MVTKQEYFRMAYGGIPVEPAELIATWDARLGRYVPRYSQQPVLDLSAMTQADFSEMEKRVLAEYFNETINCRSASHPESKGTKTMDTKEMIALMQLQGGASIFKATYLDGANSAGGSKAYAFKNAVGLDLAKDDVVVVETRDTLCLVKVTETNVRIAHVGCALSALKHAVAKVNMARLYEIKAREADAEDELAAHEVFERLEKVKKNLGDDKFNAARRQLLGNNELEGAEFVKGSLSAELIDGGARIKASELTNTQEITNADGSMSHVIHQENDARRRKALAQGKETYTRVDGSIGATNAQGE